MDIILNIILIISTVLFAIIANYHHKKKRKRDKEIEKQYIINYKDKNDLKYKKYFNLKNKKNLAGFCSVIFFISFIISLLIGFYLITNCFYNPISNFDTLILNVCCYFIIILFALFFIFSIIFNIYDYLLIKQRNLFK